jgi:small GTP-binding protein
VKGNFDTEEEQLPTIGAAYMTKKITLDDNRYMFEIWDTAGQERYEAITPLYYRSAEAAIIAFDLTDAASFTKAREWLKRLRKEREGANMPIALAGNKADLGADTRQVDAEEVARFAAEHGLKYFETSARNGLNVEEMFAWVAHSLPPPVDVGPDPGLVPLTTSTARDNSKCC